MPACNYPYMARTYTKKSPYWSQFSQPQPAPTQNVATASWEPVSAGNPFYTSSSTVLANIAKASIAGRTSADSNATTGRRINSAALVGVPDRFAAIRAGMLPYVYSPTSDCVDVRDAIELCQKAYANVAIFANAIDLMSEFANTELYFEAGTKKAKKFFEAWLKRIKIWKVCDQYFREYYRSGNVFIYRVDGAFDERDYRRLIQVYGAEDSIEGKNNVPLKYIFLNPYNVVAKASTTFGNDQYELILSKYDLLRLANPQTEDDKKIAESLPKEAKEAVQKKTWQSNGIRIKLDPAQLVSSFYKRQDYEPFAIPFGYRVLDDINAKLEMKKMDQAVLRTAENMILLITMGAKPDEGGINPANLTAMQNLFKNESVGRTLVSDWTTKAEFIIPDLQKVLGPAKYETLNKDIAEGLQNVIIGEEKYGNTQTKVQVFLEKLREARNTFLNDFLQPEINRIAKNLGMQSPPKVAFKVTDAKDPTQMWRVVTRMMELGLISEKQGLDAIRTGVFPDPSSEEFAAEQEDFVKRRRKGECNPLSPAPVLPPLLDPNTKYSIDNQKTAETAPPKAKSKSTMRQSGRPRDSKTAKASVEDIKSIVYETENLLSFIKAKIREKHGLETLNDFQNQAAESLMQSVVCASVKEDWQQLAAECVADHNKIGGLSVRPEVLQLAAEHGIESYEAALML
jgi:hypothetical protein